jgi:enoyl-CoA hydratase/carnithine racemase
MGSSAILFEKVDRIAHITLNRPKALNGITFEMMDEINQALMDIREDHRIKAAVITGAGRAFCVGADINVLEGGLHDPAQMRHFLESINQMFFNIEELPVPVIAGVNGLARAGGFELILACDLVIAAEEAQIGDNHTQFGVIPGGGATQRAQRKIGVQRAMELIFTSRWLTGREAVDYGIALRAVPLGKLSTSLEEILVSLRDKSRESLGFAKKAIIQGSHLSLEDGVNLEIRYFLEYLTTSPDAKEGFSAYQEKRTPAFAGK